MHMSLAASKSILGKDAMAKPSGFWLQSMRRAVSSLSCSLLMLAWAPAARKVVTMPMFWVQDRSFTFILKTPPASDLLKKAAKVRLPVHRRPPDCISGSTAKRTSCLGRSAAVLNTLNTW